MKSLLRLSLTFIMSIVCGTMWTQVVTFAPANDKGSQGGSSSGEDQVTKNGVTISASPTGSFGNGQQYRVYKGSTFTVSSTVGNITKVEITCTASGEEKYGPGCFTDVTTGSYSFEGTVGTWTGNVSSLSMTASTNQVRMTEIKVTIGEGSDQGPGPSPEPGSASGSGTLADPWNAVAAQNFTAALPADQPTEERYYIKGKIAKIANNGEFGERFGNATFYISDDGADANTFYIFRTLYLDNKEWEEGDRQIKVGDEVIICGKLVNLMGTTPETVQKESYIYSINETSGGEQVEPSVSGTITFDPATDKGIQGGSSSGADQVTKNGVTISATPTGSFGNGQQYRVYTGSTFTVSTTVGKITKVEITCTASGKEKYGPGCFTDITTGSYSYEGTEGTWTGYASSLSMTATINQVRMTEIKVTIGDTDQNSKSGTVFDASSDDPVNGIITKNGVTISATPDGIENNNARYYFPPQSSLTVSSENKKILMVVLVPAISSNWSASNEWKGENEQNYSHLKRNKVSNELNKTKLTSSSSTGSLVNYDGAWWGYCLYSVWEGNANTITFNNLNNYYKQIIVYCEGDELPQKEPFAVNYVNYEYGNLSEELIFYYGFKDFVDEHSYMDNYSIDLFSINEDGTRPYYYGVGQDDEYDCYVSFHNSFADYKPHNTSYWFEGIGCDVDFNNLNLSEVTDAKYMFKGAKIGTIQSLNIDQCPNLSYMFSGYKGLALDISSWQFNSNQTMTNMFENSNIFYLTIGSSINYAQNDIFRGLGSYSKPCNLVINGHVDIGQDSSNEVFSYKGGYFTIPDNKAYVVWNQKIVESFSDYYYIDYNFDIHYDQFKSYYDDISVNNNIDGFYDCVIRVYSLENSIEKEEWISDYNQKYDFLESERSSSSEYVLSDNGNFYKLEVNIHATSYGLTSTSGWFEGFQGRQINGLRYLNTSTVTDMSSMFAGCSNLTSLDLSNFDTSNVTDMSSMFDECNHLTSLDVSHFDTSKVTDMSLMFSGCDKITKLDLSLFDTSNVTNMSGMFALCYGLSSLDISHFNTSKVINMSGMFSDCSDIKILDLRHFDTSNVTDMSFMFGSDVDDMLFESLDISGFNTSNVTNMAGMFKFCSNLISLDVSNFDTSKLVEGEYQGSSEMFSGCTSLQDLTISSTMENLQENACESVGTENKPCVIYAPSKFDFGTDSNQPYFYWKGGYFVKGYLDNPYAVGDTIIYNNLKYVVTKVDDEDSEVTLVKNPDAVGAINIPATINDESGLFYFDVTAIEEMAFFNCAEITTLSIPASVRSIGAAITSCCTILNEITVDENNPYFDSRDNCNAIINTETGELLAGCNKTTIPEGVTAIGREAMRGMFDLEGIKLPSTLTYIGNRAFYYCKKLTGHLNIPEGVTEVATYAFYSCKGLTAISLPSTITTMGSCAFRECTNVTSVNCRATTPPSIDSRMFGNFSTCTLTVPVGCVDTYKNAANWKKFYKIMEESVLSVADVQVLNGNKGNIAVNLNNGSNVYNGYQFNITLPEGVDLTDSPRRDYDFTISNRYDGNPDISITPQDDGSYMVLMYSMNNTTITGSDGVIITLPVKVGNNLAPDTYTGTITDIAFNNPDNTSAFLQDVTFNIIVPAFVLGDVNHDRAVNITDVMMTVNHVVGQNPAGFYVESADVNGDHVVNISDIMAIVNLVVSASTSNAPALNRESTMDAITLTPTKDGYAVSLKNNEPYTALQMDIQLSNNAPLNVRLSEDRSDGHSVTCSDLGNGHHRVAIYSLNGHALKGSDGILFQLQTNKQDAPEIFNVQLTNNIFESVTLSNITLPTDITNIESAPDDAPAYNTQGIRATKHHRGIVIQEGRKQVRK